MIRKGGEDEDQANREEGKQEQEEGCRRNGKLRRKRGRSKGEIEEEGIFVIFSS